jgi:hypothetical protein
MDLIRGESHLPGIIAERLTGIGNRSGSKLRPHQFLYRPFNQQVTQAVAPLPE